MEDSSISTSGFQSFSGYRTDIRRSVGLAQSLGEDGQIALVGFPFVLFDIIYAAVFRIDPPYHFMVSTVGKILLATGFVAAGIGLLLDWRRLPGEVDRVAHEALVRMKESGFEVDDKQLWIGIDAKLSSLSYFYPAGDESVILVSAWAVYTNDEDLMQTMIHEMCRVYLTQKKHPSYIERTFEEVYDSIVEKYPKKWQSKMIRIAMAYPPAVFSEDVRFKVLEGSRTTWTKAALAYFGRRTAIREALALTAERRMWGNAQLVVRNSYYTAEMERHQMPDPTGIVKKANEKLLSSLPPEASTAFDYFRDVLVGLSDDITVEGFRKMLEDYLSKFIDLAEGKTNTLVRDEGGVLA